MTEETCGYVYRGGLTEDVPGDTPIVWDKDANHNNFGNVLFVDGHVTGYAGSDWSIQASPR